MEISITVNGTDLADVSKKLVDLGQKLNAIGANTEETTGPKRGRKAKAAQETEAEEVEDLDEDEAEEVEETEDEESEELDESEDEDADEDEESEDEEEGKIDPKQLMMLKKALNSYSSKHGKPKAVKILHKFAKVSQDVKAKDFSKILKALKL